MVLVNRMKEPICFPPQVKVSEWLKQLIRNMLNIDEFKRYTIKEVLQVLQTQCTGMEIE